MTTDSPGRRWLRRLAFPTTLVGTHALAIALLDRVAPVAAIAIATVAGAAVVIVLERIIPFCAAWARSRGDVPTDWTHLVVSNFAVPPLTQIGLTAAVLPLAGGAGVLGLWPTEWPIVAQLVLALVVAEFGQYWGHRLAHETDPLWRLHSTHHSPHRLYWLNAGRDHPLSTALMFSLEVIPLLALGTPEEVIAMWGLFTAIHGLFQHANIDVRLGPLNWIFSMAELHRWHHSKNVSEANHNYGANIIVWDVVFGTRYLPTERPPEEVGIGNMPEFPQTYVQQLLVPFRWRQIPRDD